MSLQTARLRLLEPTPVPLEPGPQAPAAALAP
jgi:hypothetical protein